MTHTPPTVPAKIVPDSVSSLKNDGEEYIFKKRELDFLKEYATHLDEDMAFAQLGLEHQRKSDILNNPHVKVEMVRIQKAWRFRSRLTQDFAAGEHMRLMEKFEDNYDQLETGNKPKMAGVLAKMSEANMKATGMIGSERDQAMPSVIINMDMGTSNVEVTVNNPGEQNASQG